MLLEKVLTVVLIPDQKLGTEPVEKELSLKPGHLESKRTFADLFHLVALTRII